MRWILFCNILMHFLFPKAIIDADTVLRNTLVFDIQYIYGCIAITVDSQWHCSTLLWYGLYISQSNWCTHICCIACCSTFKCDIDTHGCCTECCPTQMVDAHMVDAHIRHCPTLMVDARHVNDRQDTQQEGTLSHTGIWTILISVELPSLQYILLYKHSTDY